MARIILPPSWAEERLKVLTGFSGSREGFSESNTLCPEGSCGVCPHAVYLFLRVREIFGPFNRSEIKRFCGCNGKRHPSDDPVYTYFCDRVWWAYRRAIEEAAKAVYENRASPDGTPGKWLLKRLRDSYPEVEGKQLPQVLCGYLTKIAAIRQQCMQRPGPRARRYCIRRV